MAQIEVKLDSQAQFKTWFKDTNLIKIQGQNAEIGVKNSYSADWLSRKHYKVIQDTISYIYGEKLKLEFIVDKSLCNIPIEQLDQQDIKDERPILDVKDGMSSQFTNSIQSASLNPKYSFQNFVVGDSNNLAHAAATAVSDNPGTIYNPLFIYGSTGLGKTHIAQAVGRHILERIPNVKVLYISSENFMNAMVRSIKTGR